MPGTILHIDASGRYEGSVSRKLSKAIIDQLNRAGDATVISRDLAKTALQFVDETWIGANFTPEDDRTDEQKQALQNSDKLISELEAADTIVLGVPIYNFGVPASFKAWVDMIARARKTFQYTPNGPEGLLTGKRAIVVVTSGGTEVGSDIDFASGYVLHVLGFVGIKDVEFVAADRLMANPQAALASAEAKITGLEV